MTKFVPYEKLSKKKKRALDKEKRGSWNGLCPVTGTSKNLKIYDRKRALKGNDDSFQGSFVFRYPSQSRCFEGKRTARKHKITVAPRCENSLENGTKTKVFQTRK